MRVLKIISVIFFSITCVGCSSSTNPEIDIGDKILSYKSYGIDGTIRIDTLNDLNEITSYDDSIIYISQYGCYSCEELLPSILEYIANTNIIIYEVDINLYLEAYNHSDNKTGKFAFHYPKISSTPSFLFYRHGDLKNVHSEYIAPDDFESVINNYVVDINYVSLNSFKKSGSNYSLYHYEEDADLIFSTATLDDFLSKNDATVLFTWRQCTDCEEFKRLILEPFILNYSKTIYYYETSPYYNFRYDEEVTKQEIGSIYWHDFSEKYFLIKYSFNDSFNNKGGVTPTLVNFANEEICVFRNERDYIRNEEGFLQYKTAFFQEVQSLTSHTKVDEGDSTSSNYQKAIRELNDQSLPIEISLCTEFLNNI